MGVLVSPVAAEKAIGELLRIPLPQEAITFLTADRDDAAEDRDRGKFVGACLGGILGTASGLSLGAAAATLMVPGVGPVLAIGIGAAALLGLSGAGAGTALGASGAPSTRNQQEVVACASADAQFFRDVLNKGRSLVIVRVDSKPLAEAACAVLDRLGIGTHRVSEPAGSGAAAKVAVRHVNSIAIVDLSGRITLGEGSALLRDTVRGLVEQGHKKIMLNLGRVTHIDSTGMGELVRALAGVRSQGGELKLVNVSLPATELLRITRLATLFEIAKDETTGAASFRPSA